MNPLSSLSNDLRRLACRLVIEPILRASMLARHPGLRPLPDVAAPTHSKRHRLGDGRGDGQGMSHLGGKTVPVAPDGPGGGLPRFNASGTAAHAVTHPNRTCQWGTVPSMAWQAGFRGACVRFRMKLIRKRDAESFLPSLFSPAFSSSLLSRRAVPALYAPLSVGLTWWVDVPAGGSKRAAPENWRSPGSVRAGPDTFTSALYFCKAIGQCEARCAAHRSGQPALAGLVEQGLIDWVG